MINLVPMLSWKTLIKAQLHNQNDLQAEALAATMSTSSAADAVFSTTELFEQILSHFDIKDLVLLRQVSSHWRDVMAESLVLRRAMFLADGPELPFEWHLHYGFYGTPYRYTKEQFGAASDPGSIAAKFRSCRFQSTAFRQKIRRFHRHHERNQESSPLASPLPSQSFQGCWCRQPILENAHCTTSVYFHSCGLQHDDLQPRRHPIQRHGTCYAHRERLCMQVRPRCFDGRYACHVPDQRRRERWPGHPPAERTHSRLHLLLARAQTEKNSHTGPLF